MEKDTNTRQPVERRDVFVTIDGVPVSLISAVKSYIWQLLNAPDVWGDNDADITLRLSLTDEQIERLDAYLVDLRPDHGARILEKGSERRLPRDFGTLRKADA